MNPRVLHVTTVPMTLWFLAGHVAHAKRRGFDVHALSSPGEPLGKFGREMQIEVHAALMPRRITPLVDLAALWRIVRVIRRVQPTIVDAHNAERESPGDDGGDPLPRAGSHLSRAWTAAHDRHGLTRRILRWTERTACRLAHQVICISKSLREVLIAEGLCPPEKIKVLAHGSIDGVEADRKFNPARISGGVDTGRLWISLDAPA
jgi:hypothetical protein